MFRVLYDTCRDKVLKDEVGHVGEDSVEFETGCGSGIHILSLTFVEKRIKKLRARKAVSMLKHRRLLGAQKLFKDP